MNEWVGLQYESFWFEARLLLGGSLWDWFEQLNMTYAYLPCLIVGRSRLPLHRRSSPASRTSLSPAWSTGLDRDFPLPGPSVCPSLALLLGGDFFSFLPFFWAFLAGSRVASLACFWFAVVLPETFFPLDFLSAFSPCFPKSTLMLIFLALLPWLSPVSSACVAEFAVCMACFFLDLGALLWVSSWSCRLRFLIGSLPFKHSWSPPEFWLGLRTSFDRDSFFAFSSSLTLPSQTLKLSHLH